MPTSGAALADIARTREVSVELVRAQTEAIYAKLDACTRAELVALVLNRRSGQSSPGR